MKKKMLRKLREEAMLMKEKELKKVAKEIVKNKKKVK